MIVTICKTRFITSISISANGKGENSLSLVRNYLFLLQAFFGRKARHLRNQNQINYYDNY